MSNVLLLRTSAARCLCRKMGELSCKSSLINSNHKGKPSHLELMKVKCNNSELRLGSRRACQHFEVWKTLLQPALFALTSKCSGRPPFRLLQNSGHDLKSRHPSPRHLQPRHSSTSASSSSSLPATGFVLLTWKIMSSSVVHHTPHARPPARGLVVRIIRGRTYSGSN